MKFKKQTNKQTKIIIIIANLQFPLFVSTSAGILGFFKIFPFTIPAEMKE